MKSRSRIVLGLVVITAIAIWVKGFWFTEVFATHAKNERNREALKTLNASLVIGDPHIAVLTKFWSLPDHDLRINVNSSEAWSISMPSEVTASHWIMVLRFADSHLIDVETRSAEGTFPADAPQLNGNTTAHRTGVRPSGGL
jgi:hypothetical protein